MVVAPEEDGPRQGAGAEAGPHVIEGGVEGCAAAGTVAPFEGQDQLDGVGVVEVGDGDADEGEALGPDEWGGAGQELAGGLEDGVGAVGGPGQGVGPGDPGEVIEAEPQDDGAANPVGGPQSARDAVDQAHEDGVDRLGGVAG